METIGMTTPELMGLMNDCFVRACNEEQKPYSDQTQAMADIVSNLIVAVSEVMEANNRRIMKQLYDSGLLS